MPDSAIEKQIIDLLSADAKPTGVVGSPSDSFEVTIDIRELSAKDKLLGELVCFLVREGEKNVLVLGQITEIRTENKWHEEPSFKSVIKRHGSLPHLSGVADNRIAMITVQSSFTLGKSNGDFPEAHKLANSPSTGEPVRRISNDLMKLLMKEHEQELVCLGKAYDTDVRVPFWFKHFGDPKSGGAGDAYHTGVFGRTGSGKTTTAANMVVGYAKNVTHMSILVLDPQGQFYNDINVLPGKKFSEMVASHGAKYSRISIPDDVHLPDDSQLFAELLLSSGFIAEAFDITTEDKRDAMRESIEVYIKSRLNSFAGFTLSKCSPGEFLSQMIDAFLKSSDESDDGESGKKKDTRSKYLKRVYVKGERSNVLVDQITDISKKLAAGSQAKEVWWDIWSKVFTLFKSEGKISLDSIVDRVVSEKGNVVVLNLSGKGSVSIKSENLQALFMRVIQNKIVEKGRAIYEKSGSAQCMIVMDEAHRFIAHESGDSRIKELTREIIDAVRTVRKFGMGYMFITQTIESLDEEIRKQMRIFAFGYGLTSWSEFSKIKDIINDDAAAKFYKSFIDPMSNKKYPFMFYGPISPLSFTGSPLFLEMDGELSDF
jgi:DNA helicase HerA-like ATPase